jgi:hypothetical protein
MDGLVQFYLVFTRYGLNLLDLAQSKSINPIGKEERSSHYFKPICAARRFWDSVI